MTASAVESLVVNDVTRANPVQVLAIAKPRTVSEVVACLANSQGAVSVGGGHFSMGGQVASPGSLHIDMRGLNQILWFRNIFSGAKAPQPVCIY